MHVHKNAARPQLLSDIKHTPSGASKPAPLKPVSSYSASPSSTSTSTYKPYASSYKPAPKAAAAAGTPQMSAAASVSAKAAAFSSAPTSAPTSNTHMPTSSSYSSSSSSASAYKPPASFAPASSAPKSSGAAADVSDILASLDKGASALSAPPPAPAPAPPTPTMTIVQLRELAKECARIMTSVIKGETPQRSGVQELRTKASALIDGAKALCPPSALSTVSANGESLHAAINRAAIATCTCAESRLTTIAFCERERERLFVRAFRFDKTTHLIGNNTVQTTPQTTPHSTMPVATWLAPSARSSLQRSDRERARICITSRTVKLDAIDEVEQLLSERRLALDVADDVEVPAGDLEGGQLCRLYPLRVEARQRTVLSPSLALVAPTGKATRECQHMPQRKLRT